MMKHCPTIITALCACLLGHVPPRTSLFVFAFNSQYRRPFSRLSVQSTAAKSASISSTAENVEDVVSSDNNDVSWATHALLFSSLTDGILSNPGARSFLRYSLVSALLRKHIVKKEDQLKSSAEFSPCNGPNVDALKHLEHLDELNERGRQYSLSDNLNDSGEKTIDKWSRETLDFLMSKEVNSDALTVKIIYIPTAMYALNSESSNTPGKQRQRARADGKKRRTQLLRLVEELLFPSDGTDDNDGADGDDAVSLNLLAVTLDLDDGSIKQPEGSDDSSQFPKDDKTALSSWHPHLIYVEGGNTFWLQHCIEKGNYSQLIKDACKGDTGAVYCGKSAGAIVAGKHVATATWKGWDDPSVVPGRESYDQWQNCNGLGFVGDHSFFPHMSDNWEDLVADKKMKSADIGDKVCCLREEDVCCVIGAKQDLSIQSGPVPKE